MPRLLLSFSLAMICTGTCAFAQTLSPPKMASEKEIRQILAGSSGLKADPNGYEYLPNGNVGYRISDGKICTMQKSQVSCVTVFSDGTRLEIIDAKGNRDFIN